MVDIIITSVNRMVDIIITRVNRVVDIIITRVKGWWILSLQELIG